MDFYRQIVSLLAVVAALASGCELSGSAVSGAVSRNSTQLLSTPKLSVTPGDLSLQAGSSYQLQLDQPMSGVAFVSQDPAVASVSPSGLVAAVAAGSTVIMASAGEQTDFVNVSVFSQTDTVSQVSVGPLIASLNVGQALQMSALAYAGNRALEGRSFSWQSSNPGVATIDSAGSVTGNAAGTVQITATDTASGVAGQSSLTVVAPQLVVLTLAPATSKIVVGATQQLTAAGGLAGTIYSFSTGNAAVATVSAAGLVKAVAPGSAAITVSAPGAQPASAVVTVEAPPASVITLTPSTATMKVGESLALKASGGGGTDNSSYSWDIDTSTFGIVSSLGQVNALAVGTFTVTASRAGATSGKATITVTNLPAITLTPSSGRVRVGQTLQLNATGGGGTSNSSYAWSTSDATKATVSATGLVKGVAQGTVSISAEIAGAKTATANLIVDPALTIAVSPSAPSLAVGATVQLNATGAAVAGNANYTWKSSNAAVATVSASGLVKAIAAGTARITAAQSGATTGSATVTVTAPLTPISISPASLDLQTGESAQLNATGGGGSGNASYNWSTSAPGVATVVNGLVKAVGQGNAVITASRQGAISDTTTVTVRAIPAIGSILITPSVALMYTGGSQQFTAVAKDAAGNPLTGVNFKWSSSMPSVLAVNSAGLASPGSANAAQYDKVQITISASAGGVTGTATVNFTPRQIAFTPTGGVVYIGGSLTLTATPGMCNGDVAPTAYAWKISSGSGAFFSDAIGNTAVLRGSFAGVVTIEVDCMGKQRSYSTIYKIVTNPNDPLK
jgi:uncharacterized protein YjdB